MEKRASVLEVYHQLGYLGKAVHKWSADDRLKAGQHLYSDFYKAHASVGCINYEKPRVDSSPAVNISESMAEAQSRFSAALKAVPVEFRGVVYRVCCDDKVIEEPEEYGWRKRTAYKVEQAVLLCLGLDNLIWHYVGGKKE